jgi:hypothetical protein
MMGARDDQRQNGSSAGVCYGAGEPKAAPAERVSGRRKSNSSVSVAEAPATDRSAKVYSGGNWQKAGQEGAVGGHRYRSTGNNPRLVPPARRKFDGSKYRNAVGRPAVSRGIADLLVRMARENPTWGYDRIKSTAPATASDGGGRKRPKTVFTSSVRDPR